MLLFIRSKLACQSEPGMNDSSIFVYAHLKSCSSKSVFISFTLIVCCTSQPRWLIPLVLSLLGLYMRFVYPSKVLLYSLADLQQHTLHYDLSAVLPSPRVLKLISGNASSHPVHVLVSVFIIDYWMR